MTYHLKNGGTLSRQYHWIWVRPDEVNQEGTASWAVQQLYNNRELCWRMYGFDQLEDHLAQGGRLNYVEYTDYDDYDRTDAVYYGGDAETLFAAVKEDFFAGRIGVRRVTAGDKWGDRWSDDNSSDRYLYFNAVRPEGDGYGSSYYNVRIAVSDTATSTRAALEELTPAAVESGAGYDPGYPDEIIMEPTTIFG